MRVVRLAILCRYQIEFEKRLLLVFGCWEFEIQDDFSGSSMDGASYPNNDDIWGENCPSLLG